MQPVLFHKTRHGTVAHFAADLCIGHSLQRYGEWAQDEIALLRHYLPEGATALDVGANVGVHTLAFARLVGPAGRVVAIEGQPAAFALLAHNIVANGLSGHVTALAALAGAEEALVPHAIMPVTDNVGAKSFVREVRGLAPEPAGLRTKLPLITLDGLGLSACAVVKIDVEGMELDVLRGARAMLRALRPVVYFEHASGDAAALAETVALLREAGYRLYWHVSNPFNTRNFNGDPHNMFGGNVEINVLALPADRPAPEGLPELTDPSLKPPRPSLADGLPGVAVEEFSDP